MRQIVQSILITHKDGRVKCSGKPVDLEETRDDKSRPLGTGEGYSVSKGLDEQR